MRVGDKMMLAEAVLIRTLRERYRKRPSFTRKTLSFKQLVERSKLAGICQAVRAIRILRERRS